MAIGAIVPYIPAIASTVSSFVSGRTTDRALRNQEKALDKAGQKSPQEKEYLSRLEKRRREGDPLHAERSRMAIQPLKQMQQQSMQTAYGRIANQGLDSSIVANEIMRRTEAPILRQIAEESRRQALINAEYKQRAEQEYDKYLLSRSDYLKEIALKKAGVGSERILNRGKTFGNMLGNVGDFMKIGNKASFLKNLSDSGYNASTGEKNIVEFLGSLDSSTLQELIEGGFLQ